jgi:hypothetical protein
VLLRALVVGAALASVGCNGPFGLLPGGRLDGASSPPPDDWAFAGDSGTAQLETRPDDPYSVNIAYTVMGGRLYINAGDTETRWVKNIAADARVRLRLDGTLYALRAERVSDAAVVEAFGRAWTDQSIFRRDPSKLEVVWIYRLAPR